MKAIKAISLACRLWAGRSTSPVALFYTFECSSCGSGKAKLTSRWTLNMKESRKRGLLHQFDFQRPGCVEVFMRLGFEILDTKVLEPQKAMYHEAASCHSRPAARFEAQGSSRPSSSRRSMGSRFAGSKGGSIALMRKGGVELLGGSSLVGAPWSISKDRTLLENSESDLCGAVRLWLVANTMPSPKLLHWKIGSNDFDLQAMVWRSGGDVIEGE